MLRNRRSGIGALEGIFSRIEEPAVPVGNQQGVDCLSVKLLLGHVPQLNEGCFYRRGLLSEFLAIELVVQLLGNTQDPRQGGDGFSLEPFG